jgi:hypothetical protein
MLLTMECVQDDVRVASLGHCPSAQVKWNRAFNEVTSPVGVYYHLWNGSTATVNTGPNGLQTLGAQLHARIPLSHCNMWE